MRRRVLITAAASTAIIAALPKAMARDVEREDATPGLATPHVEQEFMRFDRRYSNEDGDHVLGVTVIAFETAERAVRWTDLMKETYLEGSEDFYLVEEFEIPDFGETSFAVSGNIDAETLNGFIYFTEGLLSYSVGYGTGLNNFEQKTQDVIDIIDKVIARADFQDHYTDEELYELLPTEDEAGYEIAEEKFSN
jgi:hypothetical protein